MYFDIQTWFPLLTIGLGIVLCFAIASLFARQAPPPRPKSRGQGTFGGP
jgi:hypothetical protein